ncbi:hypothetical protein V1512DRAFT_84647 [Lipomyces arxii]|uniref:uncharacterized protein n=1 Tax=Lipomyces arxii TaxID=56418 RepID=UPI0034CF292B
MVTRSASIFGTRTGTPATSVSAVSVDQPQDNQGTVEQALADLTPADAVMDDKIKTRLKTLRDMWQFSALFQWLFMFKSVIKMDDDDITIEVLEKELLELTSLRYIPTIRLRLLQNLTSHRNLTLENFDDFCRRQYRQKSPLVEHPFGEDEEPVKYDDLDLFVQVRVLHQLCEWQLYNAERFRDRMGSLRESEEVKWRVDPVGWDSHDNTYFLLDDNRLYKRHDPPPPVAAKPKKQKRKSYSGTRRSKRRRTTTTSTEDEEEDEQELFELDYATGSEDQRWGCVCATYSEWQEFFTSLGKIARDKSKTHERAFYAFLRDEIMPVIEAIEQDRLKDEAAKLKEIEIMRQYENRKRSSRAEAMAERRREDEAARAERERAEQERQQRKHDNRRRAHLEREREVRLAAREARLAKIAERGKNGVVPSPVPSARDSSVEKFDLVERRSTRQSQRHIGGYEALDRPVQNWYFDCVCGAHGENYDDGELSVCCGKCEIWMHVGHLIGDEVRRFQETQKVEQSDHADDADHTDHADDGKTDNTVAYEAETDAHEAERNEANQKENGESGENGKVIKEETEFVCNRCVRIAREIEIKAEHERKRELDKIKRREREKAREAERRIRQEELKRAESIQQREPNTNPKLYVPLPNGSNLSAFKVDMNQTVQPIVRGESQSESQSVNANTNNVSGLDVLASIVS